MMKMNKSNKPHIYNESPVQDGSFFIWDILALFLYNGQNWKSIVQFYF